jgi:hypothetical protein
VKGFAASLGNWFPHPASEDHSMQRLALGTVAVTLLCAGAAAQFDQFDWTLENHGDMRVVLTPDSMGFSGAYGDLPGTSAVFKTSSAVAGRVTVDTYFWTEELVCGSSLALYVLGNQTVVFSNCSYFDPISFDVDENQSFGFGMSINNPSWTADLYLSNFTFQPCWIPLGGALAGSAGTPALEGHGLLTAHKPFSVQLSGAKPLASVTLVVGFGQVNLPFKGGLLVPSVDALLLGLLSDAAGELALDSTWPSGVPGGFEFCLQAWIADPAGPKGFAASNALEGFAP